MDYKTVKPFNFLMSTKMIGRSVLDDHKIASLSDRLWRRYIELFLVSDKDGNLPDKKSVAWLLHTGIDDLENDIRELIDIGVIKDCNQELEQGIRLETNTNNGNYGVYLIKSQLGYYKIGYSGDVDRRFSDLNKASPDALELIHVIKSNNYRTLEQELHLKYADKRYSGEWFELDELDVEYIKSLEGGWDGL